MRYCFLLFVLVCFGCKKENDPGPNPAPVSLAEETQLNVAYASDPAQKMDIYLPAGRSAAATKVIVLIHGGGWDQGDKSDFTPYVDTLKRRLSGYAIFNIDYRLATGSANFFPTQENDVKAALTFIYSRLATYNISSSFVLLGASAGAHLALLQGYKYITPVKIKAVIDFFGPNDLVDMYNYPADPLVPLLLLQVTGGTPYTIPTLYQQSSPINFASAQSPPTLILHGGLDILVAPAEAITLNNRLQTLGVIHQYVFYPTEGHGWAGANLSDSFDKIIAFLAANVN